MQEQDLNKRVNNLIYSNTEKRDVHYWLTHLQELSIIASFGYTNAELAQALGITTSELKELKKNALIRKALRSGESTIRNFYNQKLLELASGCTTKKAKIKYDIDENGDLINGNVELVTQQNAPDLNALNILISNTLQEEIAEKQIIIKSVEADYSRDFNRFDNLIEELAENGKNL